MKPTTRFLLNSITIGCAAALLASCASTQSTTQNKESMLVASGFKVITPKTAAQKQKLQNLPAGTVTMVKKGKKKVLRLSRSSSQSGVCWRPQRVSGLSTASRRQEARPGRPSGRRDVSGRDDGMERLGRRRRSVGTYGRANPGRLLKSAQRNAAESSQEWQSGDSVNTRKLNEGSRASETFDKACPGAFAIPSVLDRYNFLLRSPLC